MEKERRDGEGSKQPNEKGEGRVQRFGMLTFYAASMDYLVNSLSLSFSLPRWSVPADPGYNEDSQSFRIKVPRVSTDSGYQSEHP